MIERLSEVAQVVNAFAVVVLVAVTCYYARTTKRILDESKKMREAAEKQAQAAMAQAAAAQGQAAAAFEMIEHEREQLADLRDVRRAMVGTTIDSLVRNIENWKVLTSTGTARSWPSPDGLVPDNIQDVLEYAHQVSSPCANLLSSAVDDLRAAQKEIEMVRDSGSWVRGFEVSLFPAAFQKLQKARSELAATKRP